MVFLANHQEWMSGACEHYVASSEYDFEGRNGQELNMKRGQQIRLAPSRLQPPVKGWILASDGVKVGLIPTNYIKILGRKPGVPQRAVPIPDYPYVPPTVKSNAVDESSGAFNENDISSEKDDGGLSETETIVAPENAYDSNNEADSK